MSGDKDSASSSSVLKLEPRSGVRRPPLAQESKVDPNLRGLFLRDVGQDTDVSELRSQELDPTLPPHIFAGAPAARSLLQAHEVSAALDRHLHGTTEKPSSLAGDFAIMPFPDVVTMLEMGRRPGVLAVTTPSAIGQLFFDVGELVHAVFGNLSGAEAFYRLMEEPSGQFEFSPHPCPISPETRSMNDSVTGLLMEGARLVDVDNAMLSRATNRPRVTARIPLGTLSSAWSGAPPMPALPPAPELAGEFELEIVDLANRAEFLHWSRAALTAWTQSELGSARLHIHFFAELATGISALLSLAGPGSDAALLRGLEAGSEAFGLSFQLKSNHVLDLVLIDIRNPLRISGSLRRIPCFALLAPPQGDLRSIGARARVELETVLGCLPPAGLVGIGDASLEAALQEIKSGWRGHLATGKWPGALGDRRLDLRAVIADGIRMWAPRRTLETLPPMSSPFSGRY